MKNKKIIKIIIVFYFFLFTCYTSQSQVVTLTGNEPTRIGKEIIFYSIADFISRAEVEVARCTVEPSGNYTLTIPVSETMRIFTHWGTGKGIVFIEPNRTYQLVFPPIQEKTYADYLNPFMPEPEFIIGIENSDENELNYLMQQFDDDYDKYVSKNFQLIYKFGKKSNVDNLIKKIDSTFQNSTNQYFNQYRYYKFATLRHLAYERNSERILTEYFVGKPILYQNVAYTNLFNQAAKNILVNFTATTEGKKIAFDICDAKSLISTENTFFNHTLLKNATDTLRELLLIKGLYDAFYSGEFGKMPIVNIFDSLTVKAKITQFQPSAANILHKIKELMEGTIAPHFELYDQKNQLWNCNEWKGTFVYVNFCTTSSYTCMQEFEILKTLQEKYKEVLQIVTISVDNFETTKKLIKKNNYNWIFLDASTTPELLKTYKVLAYPTYYLFDTEGILMSSPAKSPTEGFEDYFLKIIDDWEKQQIRIKVLKNERKN